MPLPRILLFTLFGALIGGLRGWIWHREKLERQKRRAPALAARPAAVLASAPVAGPEWGWVWFHAHSSGSRGLGYYYRDSARGPSLRVLGDLRSHPDEDALRAEIGKNLPSGGSSMLLGAHRIVTTDGVTAGEAQGARQVFAAGRDHEAETILLRVCAIEREVLALPERPAFVDSIF